METVMKFLTLASWFAAIGLSIFVILRLNIQGRLEANRKNIERTGKSVPVIPVRNISIGAILAWLWIVAGCLT